MLGTSIGESRSFAEVEQIMLTKKFHPTRCCCDHRAIRMRMVFLANGAAFAACDVPGCGVTWSDRDQRYFDPRLTRVAQGGKRWEVLMKLVNRDGFAIDEALSFIDGQDVRELITLVG